MVNMVPTVQAVYNRIVKNSELTRRAHLEFAAIQKKKGPNLSNVGCTMGEFSNDAHFKAPFPSKDGLFFGYVDADSEMLSSHAVYARTRGILTSYMNHMHDVTVAKTGGFGSICDGTVQGEPGMYASMGSRFNISNSLSDGLRHNRVHAVFSTGICDKIWPGVMIGLSKHSHLPVIHLPTGVMTTGTTNEEKDAMRLLHKQGKVDTFTIIQSERSCYHGKGVCTFYGTANSNGMAATFGGTMLPDFAFSNAETTIHDALIRESGSALYNLFKEDITFNDIITEKSMVNMVMGWLLTSGSPNLAMHLIAIGQAYGINITLDDIADLSAITPQTMNVFPHTKKNDINSLGRAGGAAYLIWDARENGFLFDDVLTVASKDKEDRGLDPYCKRAVIESVPGDMYAILYHDEIKWVQGPKESLDETVLRSVNEPFKTTAGYVIVSGEIGGVETFGISRNSTVALENRIIEMPAWPFNTQAEMKAAFKDGSLEAFCKKFGGVNVVTRFQGVNAIGMPEQHEVMGILKVLQEKGYKVGLLTDGRLSGASGGIAAMIDVEPEAYNGGWMAYIEKGDPIKLDVHNGIFELHVDPVEFWAREPAKFVEPPEITNDPQLKMLIRTAGSPSQNGGMPTLSNEELDLILSKRSLVPVRTPKVGKLVLQS